MNLTTFLLFGLMSLIIGAVLMILLQYYFFIKYGNLPEEPEEQRDIHERYNLPDTILNSIKSAETDSKSPIVAINLVMQFLFHELKNSNKVRKWFYRKLSLELDELIAKTTTGKLFDKLTIRDLDLGGQFPEIKNLKVHNADLHDSDGFIENLDLLLDLQYRGNFRLSIDADMVLGKKGSLTLKVKYLSGLARLQFTRKPYTHWSLSFLGDPQLELGIESQFQGRQMQSNVTNLIMNQIRKAVRRKHTLPNYKLRYKPFFHKTDDELDCDFVPNGKLEVNVVELSRLLIPLNSEQIYCTLSLSSLPWVEARQRDDQNVIVSIDKEIHKAKNQQIGMMFKQDDNSGLIDAVLPNTPAVKADIRPGDVLRLVEGKPVTNIGQVAKIIKSLNKPIICFRIERVLPGLVKNDAIYEDNEPYESLSGTNVSFSRSTESVQLIGTRQTRKTSIDRGGTTSSESSLGNTPTHSPRKSQASRPGSGKLSRENSRDDPVSASGYYDGSSRKAVEIEIIQQHSTIDFPVESEMKVGDLCTFALNDNSNYINLCVYGRSKDFNELLGYVNVPVRNIIAECSETNLGHFVKSFSFNPPKAPDLQNHILSTQSGFDARLCYGDILLSFVWNGSPTVAVNSSESMSKKSKSSKSPNEKQESESDRNEPNTPKLHNFIRTHFHRTTQCGYCGKKIWLKDAVQCRDCAMCCHKKCITKCQNATVCGPGDGAATVPAQSGQQPSSTGSISQPEFKVTHAPTGEEAADSEDGDEVQPRLEGHRQSFSDLLAQGLKRVNSANNLAIPGIVSSLSQNSRSLPPSPQHSPRKQSLVNQSTNPFVTVTQRLEIIPDDVVDLTKEQISNITEPLIGYSNAEEMMSLAKSSSKGLYSELEVNERVERINKLLMKLRLALDSETYAHANLVAGPEQNAVIPSKTTETTSPKSEPIRPSTDVNNSIFLQTKAPPSSSNGTQDVDESIRKKSIKDVEHEMARKAILIAQSEERVHALSVIMLYLCTGLQHAQGVAFQ